MFKILFVITAILFSTAVAFAGPFHLTCDVPPADQKVTSYNIYVDGELLDNTPAPMYFDIGDLDPGKYKFTATAINAWGESLPSNPYISPAAAGSPAGLKPTE